MNDVAKWLFWGDGGRSNGRFRQFVGTKEEARHMGAPLESGIASG
ncbi:MAG: hypothetical protein Q8K99_03450 [Actinomycetota bacterium]|nr:hypothetical protein [Actinomycetota bacterium]